MARRAVQVALCWLIQRDTITIPQSTHVEYMKQDIDIFDFKLTNNETMQIATLNRHDTKTVNFNYPQLIKHLIETYG